MYIEQYNKQIFYHLIIALLTKQQLLLEFPFKYYKGSRGPDKYCLILQGCVERSSNIYFIAW